MGEPLTESQRLLWDQCPSSSLTLQTPSLASIPVIFADVPGVGMLHLLSTLSCPLSATSSGGRSWGMGLLETWIPVWAVYPWTVRVAPSILFSAWNTVGLI